MPTQELSQISSVKTKSWEFPAKTQSLCPVCLGVIEAELYVEADKVFMRKSCEAHGAFKELISSDAKFTLKMRKAHYESEANNFNPVCVNTAGCPNSCGLCDKHLNASAMVNIDLTNRCNLHCPVCFANSETSGSLVQITLDQLKAMLDKIRETSPFTVPCFQLVGGEPTVHPEFIEALRMIKEYNFSQVQVASNGVRFARSAEFAHEAAEAGMDIVYLQFDGMTDDVYMKLRGSRLAQTKFAAIENLAKTRAKVMLVPTIVKGVNDHQLGDMLKFALGNPSVIAGISWQPVAITGRIDEEQRLAMRFTLADLARSLQEQTGLIDMYRDWYPFSAVTPFSNLLEAIYKRPQVKFGCHPHCGCGSYILVDTQTGRSVPVTALLDLVPAMRILDEKARAISRHPWVGKISLLRTLSQLKKYYHPENALPGWSFEDLMGFLKSFNEFANLKKTEPDFVFEEKKKRFQCSLMAAMHFQDAYNYDIQRSQRCVVSYAAPDGKFYPFCTYNAGPYHREEVEKQFAKNI